MQHINIFRISAETVTKPVVYCVYFHSLVTVLLVPLVTTIISRNPGYLTKELVFRLVLELKIKFEDCWLKRTEISLN